MDVCSRRWRASPLSSFALCSGIYPKRNDAALAFLNLNANGKIPLLYLLSPSRNRANKYLSVVQVILLIISHIRTGLFSTLHQSQIISPLVLKRIILLKQTTHKYLSSLILQHIRNIIIILHLSTTLLHTSTIHSINLSIIVVSVEFFLGENLVSLGCGNDAVGIFNEIALFVSFCGGVWFYEMN